MHSRVSHIQIRQATREDNSELIRLTQRSPMKGTISLRIDRNPDFWSLLGLRGESSVWVAFKEGEIIGSFSGSRKKVWVAGKENEIIYLADLKILPEYRNGLVAARLLQALYQHLKSQGADLCYCTIAEGNDKVLPLFKGRLGVPPFLSMGNFSVFQILPAARKASLDGQYNFQIDQAEEAALCTFFNESFQQYQLAPFLEQEDISKTINLTADQDGEIVAAISLLDSGVYKQYVVIDMSLMLKLLVQVSKITTKVLGIFRLPSIGEPIRTLHVRYVACKPGHEFALKQLLQQARNMAWKEGFHFLSVGFHEQDSLRKVCKGIAKITFNSQALVTSIHKNHDVEALICQGASFEDFSLA